MKHVGEEKRSIERERQLAAFSRDDAPTVASAVYVARKTRLVSLSFITIPCVVVEEGTHRARSVHGRRRTQGNRAHRVRASKPRACTRSRTTEPLASRSAPFPFPENRTGCSRVRASVEHSSSHASPQRSMSTRCHASA